MTYDLDAAKVRAKIETIRATGQGDFLPGDGFDKNDAPLLDAYLEGLGYRVTYCTTQGGGQFKEVLTACRISVSRNGYCYPVKGL